MVGIILSMPLTQPERDNPLMNRYFQEIDLPGKQLVRRCGVSHSQIYMARNRNVGPDNAEKISRSVANILGLSTGKQLELKAEIMGHPDNLLWAWIGGPSRASRLLDISQPTAREILNPEKTITHRSGVRALEKLREIDAPDFIVESIDRRLMPLPEPHRGLITYTESGENLAVSGSTKITGTDIAYEDWHQKLDAGGTVIESFEPYNCYERIANGSRVTTLGLGTPNEIAYQGAPGLKDRESTSTTDSTTTTIARHLSSQIAVAQQARI